MSNLRSRRDCGKAAGNFSLNMLQFLQPINFMENFRDLLKHPAPPKPDKKTLPSEEYAAQKAERLEYHKQAMEVILEEAEDVLWNKKYRKFGPDELVQEILTRVRAKGAEPSAKQIGWLEEKVLLWTIDVADEIRAIEYCQRVSTWNEEERKKLNEKYKDEPWKLLEHDRGVQRHILEYLPVINKDEKRYRFFADNPPLIVIQCLALRDYLQFCSLSEQSWAKTSSLGQATRESYFVYGAPPIFKVFKGSVAVMRAQSDVETEAHELKHLFYGRYIADRKMEDLHEMDELTAYLRAGKYPLFPEQVFSYLKLQGEVISLKNFDPEWRALKDILLRFQYAGIPAATLAARAAASSDIPEFVVRLQRVAPDKKEIKVPDWIDVDFAEWILADPERYASSGGEDYVIPFVFRTLLDGKSTDLLNSMADHDLAEEESFTAGEIAERVAAIENITVCLRNFLGFCLEKKQKKTVLIHRVFVDNMKKVFSLLGEELREQDIFQGALQKMLEDYQENLAKLRPGVWPIEDLIELLEKLRAVIKRINNLEILFEKLPFFSSSNSRAIVIDYFRGEEFGRLSEVERVLIFEEIERMLTAATRAEIDLKVKKFFQSLRVKQKTA
jgi:hypothetical protein